MKQLLMCAAFTALLAAPALAQGRNNAEANANAGAISGSQSASGSNSSVTFVNPSTTQSQQTVRYSGDYEVRSAPGIAAGGWSSGHPCAYTPANIGFSVIGGGAVAGGMQIDDACLLAQMGLMTEAWSMIAARNPQACAALVATGRIAQGSCTGSRNIRSTNPPQTVRPTTASASLSTKSDTVAYGKCEWDGAAIRLTVARGHDQTSAVQQCRAALGR